MNNLTHVVGPSRFRKRFRVAALRLIVLSAFIIATVIPVLADTIHLKDGSVLHGQVVSFNDQQFTVIIGGGSQGRRSRMVIYIEDVDSIEFDSATTTAAAALGNDDNQPPVTQTRPTQQPPVERPTQQPPPDNNRIPPRITNPQSAPSTSPTFFTIKVAVRADNANNGWSNSGLVVRRGQRLRISATGRVSLGGGRFSTPAGIAGSPDGEKLMRNEATGALIAVIGDDNDDFLLIGTRRDFVAQRDGVLFLGVNEGNLNDNTGTYDVVIEAEAGGSGTQ